MEYRKKKKQMCSNWVLAIFIIVAVLLIAAAAIFKHVAETDSKKRLKEIDREIQYQGLVTHLKKIDTIHEGRWFEANINTTANYIEKTLSAYIGHYYESERRPVSVTAYDLLPGTAVLGAIFSGSQVNYVPGLDFSVEVPPACSVDINDTLTVVQGDGCVPGDYAEGSLSIVRTTTRCSFDARVAAAAEANVTGLIVILEPGAEVADPAKRRTVMRPLPVFTVRDPAGAALVIAVESGAKAGLTVSVHIAAEFNTTVKTSYNLLISSKIHKTNDTVVVGAQMDSSPLAGPAVNDNGSGMAAVLEFAKLAAQYNIFKSAQQKVVFAFWGLGEEGQLGSIGYLESIKGTAEFDSIVAYVNAYMLGSPNYAYFVTDAAGASGEMYNASAYINYKLAGKYIKSKAGKCEVAAPADIDSDHLSFWNAGIPSTNICSGADGWKTAEEYEKYGGYIYAPYDSCYHRTCDNLKHLNKKPFELLAKAVAYTAESLIVEKDVRTVLANGGKAHN